MTLGEARHVGGGVVAPAGSVWARRRYDPYGETRYTYGRSPTDFGFTAQREDGGTGLMYYRARYYHPALGRFVSADAMVPEPGNPQDFNRYAYVRNSPLNYIDPTGHFNEETQLKEWFGDDWRQLYNKGWQEILLAAEFGDAVVYNSMTVVFVQDSGVLAGWDIGTRSSHSLQQLASSSDSSAKLALYRPQNVNQSGGPTKNEGVLMFGEATNPHGALCNGSNIYHRVMGDPGNTPTSLELPLDWYLGGGSHVRVNSHFAGFDPGLDDIVGAGATSYGVYKAIKMGGERLGVTIFKELGGWVGVIALTVEVATWTTWDTSYTVYSGQGTGPALPVPTPSVQGTPTP